MLPRKCRTLRVESLESRALLAAVPLGAPIQLSTSGFTQQDDVKTAATPSGGFVSVWRDSQLDGNEGGIYSRSFNSNGVALGNPVRINNNTIGDQLSPSVAVDANGRTLYGWGNTQFESGFSYTSFINSRSFSSAGVAEGPASELERIPGGFGWVQNPDVFYDNAMNSFVIYDKLENREDLLHVVRTNPAGVKTASYGIDLLQGFRGSPNNPNPWTISNANYNVQVLANGTVLVGFEIQRERLVVDVGPRWDHKALVQRWSSNGSYLGSVSLYNTGGPGSLSQGPSPGVINLVGRQNAFVAGWFNAEGDYFVRNFNAMGTATSNATKLLSRNLQVGYGFRDNTAMAILPNGRIVVAWNVEIPFSNDLNYVREFLPNGTPVGSAAVFDSKSYHVGPLDLDVLSQTQLVVSWVGDSLQSSQGLTAHAQRIAINYPPTISGITNQTYALNSSAISLAPLARVVDGDSANFDGGKLTVRVAAGANASNRIELQSNRFVISGLNLILKDAINGDKTIGRVNANAGIGTTAFLVTWNANANASTVQLFMRSLRFRTVGSTLSQNRVIEYSLSDGDGGTSNKVLQTIN